MSLITIEQLLESVDLDFEPRWVTKDNNGTISIFTEHPECRFGIWASYPKLQTFGKIKLTEFENKDWQECIYEVPRKTTGKITNLGKIELSASNMSTNKAAVELIVGRLNQVIDAVNELKGDKE